MDDRVQKLVGHAEHLLRCLVGLKLKYALLSPMIFDGAVQEARGAGKRAEGFAAVRRAMFFDCIQDVVKLAFDCDDRTPSITKIVRGLGHHNARGDLRNEFVVAGPDVYEIDDIGNEHFSESATACRRSEDARSFDDTYASVIQRWHQFQEQPWVLGFRVIRDKVTAHLQLKKVGNTYELAVDVSQFGIKWSDVGEAIQLLEPLVLDLYLLITRSHFLIDSLNSHFQRVGREFWG